MTDDLVSKIVSIYFQQRRRASDHLSLSETPPSLILMRLFPDTSLHFSLRLNGSSVCALHCTATPAAAAALWKGERAKLPKFSKKQKKSVEKQLIILSSRENLTRCNVFTSFFPLLDRNISKLKYKCTSRVR